MTENYGADKATVLKLLNESLATEIVCTLRYRRHYFMAKGLTSAGVAEEFLEHANEEQAHADQFAERIVQLGGEPDFNPDGLASRSHAEYVEGESLIEMIREDLVAERIAIESYRDIIRYLGERRSHDAQAVRRRARGRGRARRGYAQPDREREPSARRRRLTRYRERELASRAATLPHRRVRRPPGGDVQARARFSAANSQFNSFSTTALTCFSRSFW